jgi:hypothetical protein
MKVLYPKDSYTVSGSTYSDTTNNVFHLNDPSIPLFSGSASLMCSSTQFYNSNGDLTTGTKLCASDDSNFKAENIKVGISVAGVTGTYAAPSAPSLCSASLYTSCMAGTNFPSFVKLGSEDKILLGQTLGGVTGNVVMPLEADVRNTVSYGVSGTGKTGTYTGPPAPPSNFVSTEFSPTQIDHTWDPVSDASSYLLIANEGSPVSFTPVPSASSTYTAGNSVSDGVVVYNDGVNGSVVSPISHTVSLNSTYHYALYSYDGSDYSIVASTNTVTTGDDCSDLAGEWVRVPGNPAYEANDFCVMKYEAKCSNTDGKSCGPTDTPTSTIAGTPWVEINQTEAIDACDDIPGAQLISNEQWMTIATNIANQASNWEDGSVGSGALNRGNSNGTSALAATGSHGAWSTNRRTHTLSNGEVIWDMAGNVWEWTSYYDPNNKPTPANDSEDYVDDSNVAAGTTQHPLTEFISQEGIDGNWSRNEGTGSLGPGSEGSGGALLRGGYWPNNTVAGVFAVNLNEDSSFTNESTGFRCVRL